MKKTAILLGFLIVILLACDLDFNDSSGDGNESDEDNASDTCIVGQDKFLWKPISESDRMLVILHSYSGGAVVQYGDNSETGDNRGASNGYCSTIRFDMPGASYGTDIIISAGTRQCYVANGTNRVESCQPVPELNTSEGCPSGTKDCGNGRCIPDANYCEVWCNDPDENTTVPDIYQKTTARFMQGDTLSSGTPSDSLTDNCSSSQYLLEAVCLSTAEAPSHQMRSCGQYYYCSNGACVLNSTLSIGLTCQDNDGNNLESASSAVQINFGANGPENTVEKFDACLNTTHIKEAVCINETAAPELQVFECPGLGTCEEGRCIVPDIS